eukprot:415146-Pelagomonas_calceolata.AAC.3
MAIIGTGQFFFPSNAWLRKSLAALKGQIAALRDVVQAAQFKTQERLDQILALQQGHSSDLARLYE